MEFDEDYDDTEREAERLMPPEARTPRQAIKARPLARRLIEQAWEQQELSKSLADFDDYVV
jgi:hypothetical protein